MNKYRVLLLGQNFLMGTPDGPKKFGFYTTRFVEAANEQDAEMAAVDLLRRDETLRGGVTNTRDDPPRMYAEEIEQVDTLEPMTGFAFFEETPEP